jgi:hypothetical protein
VRSEVAPGPGVQVKRCLANPFSIPRILVVLVAGFMPQSRAFDATPTLISGAQALEFHCRPGEEDCIRFCEGADSCVQMESPCPGCAGTGNLRLKRILDSIGFGLRAHPPERTVRDFFWLLKRDRWISLHPRTLYNYSGPWNGPAIRAAFLRVCDGLPGGGEGMVFLGVDGPAERIPAVLGVLCRDVAAGTARWWGFGIRPGPSKENQAHE